MRSCCALLSAAAVTLGVPAAAGAKGFSRAVLIGEDGHSIRLQATERAIAALLNARPHETPRGGYLRLFFIGPGEFPAAPARYYAVRSCVALDWPTYERSCRRIDGALGRLFGRADSLRRFRAAPTVLTRIVFHGRLGGLITTAAALEPEVELAVDRASRSSPRPGRCYAFSGLWHGPAAQARPRSFFLCPTGIWANGRLYPLDRAVWAWFQLNAG